MPALSTRASFLLCEVFKERRQYKELTQYFIKMISDVSISVYCIVFTLPLNNNYA